MLTLNLTGNLHLLDQPTPRALETMRNCEQIVLMANVALISLTLCSTIAIAVLLKSGKPAKRRENW